MINTKPTHNLRRPTNARDSPYEQNPQVKGISLGSRDRTRTYNLPVNSRTLCQLSYAGLAGAGANELEGAAVPADWCRGDKGSAPAWALMRQPEPMAARPAPGGR